MFGRILEIASPGCRLRLHRGFVVVDTPEGEAGRVPLADLEAVILNSPAATVSAALLGRLAAEDVPVVVTDHAHHPTGMLIGVDGHHVQAMRFDAQLGAGRPLRKQIWTRLVRAKIRQQEATLIAVGRERPRLGGLAGEVRSGDPDNIEAQAARIYWQALLGDGFRRGGHDGDANAKLNYGYTVLRATTARAVIAAGLHPTLGVHHQHQGNPMRLVDDLMEPFRPFIDLHVARRPEGDLDTDAKRGLVEVLAQPLTTPAGSTPLGVVIQRAATSLAMCYLAGDASILQLPAAQVPC